MPNWNYNEVTIDAPENEVREYLVFTEEKNIFDMQNISFNMHKIFPEKFPTWDPTGAQNWDYLWACDHTGTKWFPCIDAVMAEDDEGSYICYDSAWVPNNLTLLKLSEITGWEIKNEYGESNMCFEGTFICKAWKVLLDEEREYRQCCEICEGRYLTDELPEDAEEHCFCPSCYNKRGG